MKIASTALALLAAGAAHAEEYNAILADKSTVAFVYRQMNVPVDGRFGRFAAQLRFDPAKPAAATASIEIDLASIDAGSGEANDEVAGKLWFNTKAYPTARFVATSFRALGGNRYEAAGKLSIKGRTQDATAPFAFSAQGRSGIAEGALTIRRADFAIGEGVWADFGTVANEVQVKFRLQAEAQANKK
ncbi:MAG: YceI family protein [Rhodocyclales bacterium]|nr:YceI family protein [Rhodocyclales bacterium]